MIVIKQLRVKAMMHGETHQHESIFYFVCDDFYFVYDDFYLCVCVCERETYKN